MMTVQQPQAPSLESRLYSLRDRLTNQYEQGKAVNGKALKALQEGVNALATKFKKTPESRANVICAGATLWCEVEEQRLADLKGLDPKGIFPKPSQDYFDLHLRISGILLEAAGLPK